MERQGGWWAASERLGGWGLLGRIVAPHFEQGGGATLGQKLSIGGLNLRRIARPCCGSRTDRPTKSAEKGRKWTI